MRNFSAFELDDLGIIPRRNESEEAFIERGARIFFVSKYGKYETFATALDQEKIILVSPRFQRRIKRETAYLKERYGVDLEWVNVFMMDQSWYESAFKKVGVCKIKGFVIEDELGSVSVDVPIVLIVLASSTRHELIHAAREFCLGDYKKNKGFEEMIANNRYNEIFSLDILCNALLERSTQVFNIGRARKILKKYFGEKHGYVFIRLTCKEILDYVVSRKNPYSNPMNYLFEMSKKSLRHWIMCKKLGIL